MNTVSDANINISHTQFNIDVTSAQWGIVSTPDGEESQWIGDNTIELQWDSMAAWGTGYIQVTIDYLAQRADGQTIEQTRELNLSPAEADLGTTVQWSPNNRLSDAEYAGIDSITNVRVDKFVDGEWVKARFTFTIGIEVLGAVDPIFIGEERV